MITRECQFMIGHLTISGQFIACRDIARQVRAMLGPGAPIHWDVCLLTTSGVVRMIGYRP